MAIPFKFLRVLIRHLHLVSDGSKVAFPSQALSNMNPVCQAAYLDCLYQVKRLLHCPFHWCEIFSFSGTPLWPPCVRVENWFVKELTFSEIDCFMTQGVVEH